MIELIFIVLLWTIMFTNKLFDDIIKPNPGLNDEVKQIIDDAFKSFVFKSIDELDILRDVLKEHLSDKGADNIYVGCSMGDGKTTVETSYDYRGKRFKYSETR